MGCTGSGDENFDEITVLDLDLEEGWIIIHYEIEEVFESKGGRVFPKITQVTKMGKLPDDLTWETVGGT